MYQKHTTKTQLVKMRSYELCLATLDNYLSGYTWIGHTKDDITSIVDTLGTTLTQY